MFTLGHGTIYYEDGFMLVINKPAGMLVHPTVKEDGSTLYNFVKRYYEARNIESGLHPVSRLDRNTSGLVVFAKQPRIQFLLSQQQMVKKYLGITVNLPPAAEGIIEAPIARKEGSIIERCISEAANMPAPITACFLQIKTWHLRNLRCTRGAPTRYACTLRI